MNTFIVQILAENKEKNPFYIRVKISSGMPRTEIVGQLEDEDGTYKIKVGAKPVRGAANRELCKFLKKALNASDVAIVSGGRDKVKLIRISR